jgi:RHS repeat-associated protein
VTGLQSYRYDGQGRRVLTTDADTRQTSWIYSQAGQVLYTDEGRRNRLLNYIYLGNTQVAVRAVDKATSAVTVTFQHTDALGSPVAETPSATPTAANTVRHSYAPYGEAFGEASGSSVDGTGYTGHVMDGATNLTYMQQRYYDPQVGRFLSRDPINSEFNRYSYASNNPYRFTDPDGRMSVEDRRERAAARREQHERNERDAHSGNGAGQTRSETRVGAQPDGSVHPASAPLGPLPVRNYPEYDKDKGQYEQAKDEAGYWGGYWAQGAANKARGESDASGLPGRENGPRDALRHSIAGCEVARETSIGTAIRLGDIHEVYFRGSPEATYMDRLNNRYGAENSVLPGTCPDIMTSAIQNNQLYIMPSSTWKDDP